MNLTRLHISVFLGIAVFVWSIVLLAQGKSPSFEELAPFGIVVTLLSLVALAFEKYLWYQPFLHNWFFTRPDLRGTWKVELQSNWENQKDSQKTPPIICYMGVEQTLSKLQMHLMTPESESWFIAYSIDKSLSENGYRIVGVYTNTPQIHLRVEKSKIHFGAIIIGTHGPSKLKPDLLIGEYWTDRKTTGRMTFSNRIDSIKTHYNDASSLFEGSKT